MEFSRGMFWRNETALFLSQEMDPIKVSRYPSSRKCCRRDPGILSLTNGTEIFWKLRLNREKVGIIFFPEKFQPFEFTLFFYAPGLSTISDRSAQSPRVRKIHCDQELTSHQQNLLWPNKHASPNHTKQSIWNNCTVALKKWTCCLD